MEIDETGSKANRETLVQADAHKTNVALARPVRLPYVRPPVSSVLGRTFIVASRLIEGSAKH